MIDRRGLARLAEQQVASVAPNVPVVVEEFDDSTTLSWTNNGTSLFLEVWDDGCMDYDMTSPNGWCNKTPIDLRRLLFVALCLVD